MNFEKSCGGIIYNNQLQFLLVKMKQGHWSFPKGHQEENETDIQTAIREIKEETNVDVLLHNEAFDSIAYSPGNGSMKTVIYFIGHAMNNNLIPCQEEIAEIKWVRYEDALDILTYDNDKQLLEKAFAFLVK